MTPVIDGTVAAVREEEIATLREARRVAYCRWSAAEWNVGQARNRHHGEDGKRLAAALKNAMERYDEFLAADAAWRAAAGVRL